MIVEEGLLGKGMDDLGRGRKGRATLSGREGGCDPGTMYHVCKCHRRTHSSAQFMLFVNK